jgi:hypothetical protein
MQSSGISFQEQFPIARLVTHVELGSLGGDYFRVARNTFSICSVIG